MYLAQTITLFLLAIVLQCSGQDRIFGGEPVDCDRFPYFTVVRVSREVNGITKDTKCGGSLITSEAVLVRIV